MKYQGACIAWTGKISIFVVLATFCAGCSWRSPRDGIISQELPLTVDDLAEIRNGEENHKRVLETYWLYSSPKLEAYLNLIAANVAEVSTRPHLPYKVYILDTDSVNIFGGPGGFIYMTRGLLEFVSSEAEIAGIIAHEIGHISHYDYAHIPQASKMQLLYRGMLKGTELAKDSIGTYGTAAHYGVKYMGKAAPSIARRFGKDEEVEADKRAVEYLIAAGYDPRGFDQFMDRLAKVPMDDVVRFVDYMNVHPPFQVRREMLNEEIQEADLIPGEIDMQMDTLNEVRQMAFNQPEQLEVSTPPKSGSILFETSFGLAHSQPAQMNATLQARSEKLSSKRRPVLA